MIISAIKNNVISDANTVIKKREITRFAATFSSVAKSISSHKSNLSTLASVESIALKVTIIAGFSLRAYPTQPYCLLMSHTRNHTLRSLIYIYAMLHWIGLHLQSHASWLCFLPCLCRTFTKSFMTKRNESSPYQTEPLIPRPNNMRSDKTSDMLFLNDLDSFDVQKIAFKLRFSKSSKSIAQGLIV